MLKIKKRQEGEQQDSRRVHRKPQHAGISNPKFARPAWTKRQIMRGFLREHCSNIFFAIAMGEEAPSAPQRVMISTIHILTRGVQTMGKEPRVTESAGLSVACLTRLNHSPSRIPQPSSNLRDEESCGSLNGDKRRTALGLWGLISRRQPPHPFPGRTARLVRMHNKEHGGQCKKVAA